MAQKTDDEKENLVMNEGTMHPEQTAGHPEGRLQGGRWQEGILSSRHVIVLCYVNYYDSETLLNYHAYPLPINYHAC